MSVKKGLKKNMPKCIQRVEYKNYFFLNKTKTSLYYKFLHIKDSEIKFWISLNSFLTILA